MAEAARNLFASGRISDAVGKSRRAVLAVDKICRDSWQGGSVEMKSSSDHAAPKLPAILYCGAKTFDPQYTRMHTAA